MLDHFHEHFGVDEFILHMPIKDKLKRLKSLQLLSPANLLENVQTV